jgi:hypothetical protein
MTPSLVRSPPTAARAPPTSAPRARPPPSTVPAKLVTRPSRSAADPTVEVMSIDVRPATADRWSDVVAVFGRRGEDPSWCWCRLFLRSEPAEPSASEAAPDNRSALHQEIIHAEVAPGLIAYVDDHPAGWTRIGPRSAFPGVQGNKALARPPWKVIRWTWLASRPPGWHRLPCTPEPRPCSLLPAS